MKKRKFDYKKAADKTVKNMAALLSSLGYDLVIIMTFGKTIYSLNVNKDTFDEKTIDTQLQFLKLLIKELEDR